MQLTIEVLCVVRDVCNTDIAGQNEDGYWKVYPSKRPDVSESEFEDTKEAVQRVLCDVGVC